MSEWLAFHIEAKGEAFTLALTDFKTAVPSMSRRWDGTHRYWLFDPSFANAVATIQSAAIQPAVSLVEDDRRFGRTAVADDAKLDTDLIGLQFGDLVTGDGIGRTQGNKAARAEFERRLREAETS
jgi:hypothetical protein